MKISVSTIRRAVWIGALLVASLLLPSSVHALDQIHVVRRGENLTSIARRYDTTVKAIVAANGLRNANYIWVGQRLHIPGKQSATVSAGTVHTVRRGENLTRIAQRYGTSVSAIVQANGLRNPNRIWVGQRLRIPSGSSSKAKPSGGNGGSKWIQVDLSSQTTLAFQGDTVVRRMKVSTGISRYPTPTGRFRIYAKYRSVTMSGPGYHLTGVPHTMYFYRGYALHGTYWHNNFGHRMSHGCVNLSRADAAWLYAWAPKGTLVVVQR